MSTRKTKLDCKREDIAHEINGGLLGSGISVVGGGSSGPYTVTINQLNRREMTEIVEFLKSYRYGKPAKEGTDA